MSLPTRRTVLAGPALAAAAALLPRGARAQEPVLRIGVLTDMSGTYQDAAGPLAVTATQQAVAESGLRAEVVSADHQNKADVATSIARAWFDRDGVDMIVDGTNSACGLAIAGVAKERNKIHINSGAATSEMTGALCNANTLHWTYDTYMLAKSTATQLVKLGGKKWFFITADYVFGQQLERDAAKFVREGGGTVVGQARYPFPDTTDFSSFLLQAQASGADVIGFASAGNDTVNGVKQAHEFGLGKMKMAALLAHPTDVEAIGPELAQGLYLTNSFYWDRDEASRAFTRKVIDRMPQKRPPNMIQAGCYAGTINYLKAVQAIGPAKAKADGAAVVAQMKSVKTSDGIFEPSTIRADGRALFPAYLLQAKTPKDVKSEWDLLTLVATTPGDEAWRPLGEGGCPLVRS